MMRPLLAAAGAFALAACAAVPVTTTETDATDVAESAAPTPAAAPTASSGPTPRRAPSGGPVAQALAARDRPPEHVAQDEGRHSAQLLAFSGIEPGDRVLDLGAFQGYSSWLLSSLVGPEGAVVAQNPAPWTEFAPVLPAMAALTAARPNTTHQIAPFDRLEGDSESFDAAYSALIYHDAAYMDVDRGVMNRRLYELLKPGGVYVVVDHHAAPGSGLRDVESLHRIDPAQVRREVESVGFRFDAESDVLVRPEDDLTLNVFDDAIRGRTSQFAYRFVKPEM
jgi:predicted methyltransferase